MIQMFGALTFIGAISVGTGIVSALFKHPRNPQ